MDLKTKIKFINKMNGESSSELINVSIDKGNNINHNQRQASSLEETKNLLKKNTNKTQNEILTRRLIILSAFLSFMITSLSLSLILIIVRHFHSSLKLEPINETQLAIGYKASNFLLENINQSVDPCFNFYEFSCGNWISRQEEETDQFTIAIEHSLTDLASILDEKIQQEDTQIVINLKAYFKSCINQTDIELNSDIQFIEFMSKKFSMWPMIRNELSKESYQSSFFDIEDYLANLVSFRIPLVFRFESIDHDGRMIMKLTGTEDFCIMQKYLPKNAQTKAEFKKLIKQILTYFSYSIKLTLNEQELDEQFEDMIQLVSELYFLNDKRYSCLAPRSRHSILYFNVKELNENFTLEGSEQKLFDFDKFVNLLNDVSSTKFSKSNKILISSTALNYLKDLLNALKQNLKMNKRRFHTAFLNFIYFHTLLVLLKPVELFSVPHIHTIFPMRYYQAFFEYEKTIDSKRLPLENFKSVYRLSADQNCANSVIDSFSFANSVEQIELQRYFVQKKFNSNIKQEATQILKNLLNATIELINEQKWIETNAKKRIEEKLLSLETYIGYSDSIDDGSALVKINKTINYNLTNHYIFNIFKMREKQFEIEFDAVENNDSIRKKSDFDMFLSTPLFLKEFNTLVFPAIVLMEPIFNLNNPIYLNYATVGVYLAHELWHSIEDEMLVIPKLFEGLDCLNENYKVYLNKTNENPTGSEATLEEQIADNFGILVALKAYLKLSETRASDVHTNKKINDHLLPGLSYSRVELFFMRYSTSYCRKLKKNKNRIENFHVVHDYRAFQTSLLPEFVRYFQCNTQNKYMLKKCNIFEFRI